ncbi:MAG: hypothetical protein FJ091_10935 [Deltaproteobacteria bacterium]|nr:hypothetical protein [Deltaproteobacteria bacterium]
MKKLWRRAGKLVLLLLLAELLFFFMLGTRIRELFEGPREVLGAVDPRDPAQSDPNASADTSA